MVCTRSNNTPQQDANGGSSSSVLPAAALSNTSEASDAAVEPAAFASHDAALSSTIDATDAIFDPSTVARSDAALSSNAYTSAIFVPCTTAGVLRNGLAHRECNHTEDLYGDFDEEGDGSILMEHPYVRMLGGAKSKRFRKWYCAAGDRCSFVTDFTPGQSGPINGPAYENLLDVPQVEEEKHWQDNGGHYCYVCKLAFHSSCGSRMLPYDHERREHGMACHHCKMTEMVLANKALTEENQQQV